MIGVSGGMAATLGQLQPNLETLIQMGAVISSGMLIGLGIASRIKVFFVFFKLSYSHSEIVFLKYSISDTSFAYINSTFCYCYEYRKTRKILDEWA